MIDRFMILRVDAVNITQVAIYEKCLGTEEWTLNRDHPARSELTNPLHTYKAGLDMSIQAEQV